MDQLIWFSAPGTPIVFALVVTYPYPFEGDGVAALVAATPMIGFLFHQGFRVLFEALKGYENSYRKVIPQIADDFRLSEMGRRRRRKAFEIWEITFYGEKFPSAFRNHDREAWHYILSFWSVALTSVLGLILLPLFTCYFESHVKLKCFTLAIYFVTFVTFLVKGWQTYCSLVRQELAVYRFNFSQFKCIADSRRDYELSLLLLHRSVSKKEP